MKVYPIAIIAVLALLIAPQLALATVITTDTTTNNLGRTNLLNDSAGSLWYVTQNTTHVNIYSDSTGSWALNSSNNDNFTDNAGWASAIDSNDVIHIAASTGAFTEGYYKNFSTVTGAWYTMNAPDWEGEKPRMVVDEDTDIVYVLNSYFPGDEPQLFWRNATTGAWSSLQLNANNDDETVHGLAYSNNFILSAFGTTASSRNVYYNLVNTTSHASATTGIIPLSDTVVSADVVTVDYDDDELLVCGFETTFRRFECEGTSGGSVVGAEKQWDLDSYGDINQSDSFVFARTNDSIYAIFSDSNAMTFAVEMNNTDVAGDNYDFNFDAPMQLYTDADITTTNAPSVVYANGTQIWFAYKGGTTTYVNRAFGLRVRAFDEETNNSLKEWDIQVSNSTRLITESNITSYDGLWGGADIEIRVAKTGYGIRTVTLYGTMIYGDYYPLDVFLLNSSNGNWIVIYVTDINGDPISGASIVASRFNNVSYIPVETTLTDGAGVVSMFLDPTELYRINATYGSITNITYIKPVTSPYWIRLGTTATAPWNISNATAPISGFYDFLNKDCKSLKNCTSFCNNNTTTFWVALNVTTSLHGWWLELDNGTQIWNATNTTIPFNHTYNWNPGNYSGNVKMYFWRTVDEGGVNGAAFNITYGSYDYYFSKYLCYADGYYNTSIMSVVNHINTGDYGIPCSLILIFMLFLTIIISGLCVAMINNSYSAIGGIIIFIAMLHITAVLFPTCLPSVQYIIVLILLLVILAYKIKTSTTGNI